MTPLVSVITPTWERQGTLLHRCVPSVQAQTYPHLEHVIVSDGPDPHLPGLLDDDQRKVPVRFDQLAEHDPSYRWGHRARLRGLELAKGDLVAWLDDDNSFRPEHVELLAQALQDNPDAGFAYSQIAIGGVIGADPPHHGQIDTSTIMSRRSLYDTVTWRDQGQQTIEWDLVERWIAAGFTWVFVPQITANWRQ